MPAAPLAAAAVAAGVAIGYGHVVEVGVGLLLLGAFAIGLWRWDMALAGALVFVPFAGLITVALYPRTAPGALAKDVLFVLPAYLGVAVALAQGRERLPKFSAPVWIAVGVLIALVLAQSLNPDAPSILSTLIGVKIWVFYVPVMVLGAIIAQHPRRLKSVLLAGALASIPSLLVGILEAALLYAGKGDLVYGLYGPAAAAVTQDFAQFDFGGRSLVRVPSTFTFVTQYYLFTACSTVLGYMLWRGDFPERTRALGRVVFVLSIVAGFTSGARSAFFFTPALVAFLALLDRQNRRAGVRALVLGLTAGVSGLLVLGLPVKDIYRNAYETLVVQSSDLILDAFPQAFASAPWGLGTGSDTNAARHAFETTGSPLGTIGLEGEWFESWWVKAAIEFGVVGLVLVSLVYGTLVRALFRARSAATTNREVVLAAAALAVWTLLYSLKGQYLDFDPLNIYFWLFVGLGLGIAGQRRPEPRR